MAEQSIADRVTQTVATILEIETVHTGLRFAELGGDSIQAVQVLSRCWNEMGVELPLGALTPETTIDAFIAEVQASLSAGRAEASVLPELATAGWTAPAPRQKMLYALWRLMPELPTYNVPVVLWLDGPLDVERLAHAMDGLISRHAALRTVFRDGPDGRPQAQVMADSPIRLEQQQVSDQGGASAIAESYAREPFDLGTTPLRAMHISYGPDRHALVLVVHHIVCDGWALNVLLSELGSLYGDGTVATPAPDPAQLATWEAAKLTPQRQAEHEAAWARRLQDVPTIVELSDRVRQPAQSHRGDRVELRLTTERLSALNRQAKHAGTTPFVLIAVAFGIMLSRYAGRPESLVGIPLANRYHPGAERAVTFLSNTLPVHLDFRGNPTLATAIERASRALKDAEEGSALPFDAILSACAAARTPSHHPLFQVALVHLGNRLEPLAMQGLRIRREDLGTGTSKFDQSWYLEERDGQLEGYVEFATDLFDAERIRQMTRHLHELLEQVSNVDLSRRAGDLAMLASAEKRALTARLSRPAPMPQETVVQWFLEKARSQPSHPALWWQGSEVSYAELAERSAKVAAFLLQQGVSPDTLIGVCIERSPDQMAAVLGILLAGGAYLPLDPAYPQDRLKYMIADSKIQTVLSRAAHDGLFQDCGVAIWDVTVAQAGPVAALTAVPVRPDSLAYTIYTSGSTGAPKGVELTHGSLANVVEASRKSFPLGPQARVLQFVSLSFDASVWDIFMALCTGATLCLGPADITRAEQSLPEVITQAQATLVFLPPALLSVIDPETVPTMRCVISGGDRNSAELRDRWAKAGQFVAAYGPTEGTIVQTWASYPAGQPGPPPIGHPFQGVRLYVLDADLAPVPYGAIGEVYVGGLVVGRGYRFRPALTADRFLPDPFTEKPGERMYRTGDLVRRRTDDELMFVGRADTQVKIRGFRIELGEVQSALAKQPGVAEAVAVIEPAASGQPQLVAYVVALPGKPALRGPDIRQRMKAMLPEHLVPVRVEVIDALPRTINGKVDYSALARSPRTPGNDLLALLEQLERMTDEEAHALAGGPAIDNGE